MSSPRAYRVWTETGIANTLRETLGLELHEIAGAILAGEIPLRADVVNRLIARQLAQSQGPIESVHVAPRDGQRIDVSLSLKTPKFLPAFRIDVAIEQQPAFPQAPVLALRWTMPAMGPLASFAAPVVASFTSLPSGVRLDGERVFVDVAEVARSRGLGDLIRYVGSARLTAREGTFVVEFALRIPE